MSTADDARLDRQLAWMERREAVALKQKILFVKLSPRRYGVFRIEGADSFILGRTLAHTPERTYITLTGPLIFGPATYEDCTKFIASECHEVHPLPPELARSPEEDQP